MILKNTRYPQYNQIIKRKQNMLHELVYNKEYCIQNISLNLYEKMKNAKTICVVGNGPVQTNHSKFIDSCDFVIRFNNYSVDTNPLLVGKKTNLQINCLMSYSIFNSWIRDSDFILPIESISIDRYKELFMSSYKHPNLILAPMKMIYLLKSFGCDYTRGFYGLSMCIQIKKNINPDLQIYIYGFGGKGHHYNPNNIMHHNHLQELDVIKSLQKNNIIINLNHIHHVPIIKEIIKVIKQQEIPIIKQQEIPIIKQQEIPIIEEQEIPIVEEEEEIPIVEEQENPVIPSKSILKNNLKEKKSIFKPVIKSKISFSLNNKVTTIKSNKIKTNKKKINKKVFKTGKYYLKKHRNRNN